MKRIVASVLVVAAVQCFAGDEDVLKERQKGKLFPVLDPELLHEFEAGTFKDFKAHPLREELKVDYDLALSGYWLVSHSRKMSEEYNNFALEGAKKYGLKNEEGQAVMGSAMLAAAYDDRSNSLVRISEAIHIFKEAGGTKLQCDAMWVQAKMQHENGMFDESLNTLHGIESLVEGPDAEFIKEQCRKMIAQVTADKSKQKR